MFQHIRVNVVISPSGFSSVLAGEVFPTSGLAYDVIATWLLISSAVNKKPSISNRVFALRRNIII